MIYPDQFKCLICKKRYYGCKNKKIPEMVACSSFVAKFPQAKRVMHVSLARCLFGVCPIKYLTSNR